MCMSQPSPPKPCLSGVPRHTLKYCRCQPTWPQARISGGVSVTSKGSSVKMEGIVHVLLPLLIHQLLVELTETILVHRHAFFRGAVIGGALEKAVGLVTDLAPALYPLPRHAARLHTLGRSRCPRRPTQGDVSWRTAPGMARRPTPLYDCARPRVYGSVVFAVQ